MTKKTKRPTVRALQLQIAELTAQLRAAQGREPLAQPPAARLTPVRGQGPHLVIEGDNLLALSALRSTHAGRVDVIYIDPPYNTGNSFNYADQMGASAWLYFMEERLTLARELLAPDGSIFVSIGEDEFARLSLLMEEVFGADSKLGTFVVRTKSRPTATSTMFNRNHDYVIAHAPGLAGDVKQNEHRYSNPDGDPRGPWLGDNATQSQSIHKSPGCFYPMEDPATGIVYPANPDAVWRYGGSGEYTIRERIAEGRILFNPEHVIYETVDALMAALEDGTAPRQLQIYRKLDALRAGVATGEVKQRVLDAIPPVEFWVNRKIGTRTPLVKRFYNELKSNRQPVSSLILRETEAEARAGLLDELKDGAVVIEAGNNSEGKSALNARVPGNGFSYPKPVSLVRGLIEQVTLNKKDAIILDFFAGSGTTGEAVLSLNAKDGGTRRMILINQRESTGRGHGSICEHVILPRLDSCLAEFGGEGYQFLHAEPEQEEQAAD